MTKKIGKNNMIFLLCVFAIALVNQPLLETAFQRTIRGIFVSFAYITLAIFWGFSVLDRIREVHARKIMMGIVGLILFWLLIRACKYEIWDDKLDIALWYLFYLPQTLLPLMVFHMTLYIDGKQQPKWEKLLYISATLLILGILTNNMHEMAFRFSGVVSSKSGAYSYGMLYYVSLIWMMGFMLAAMVNATQKSRLLQKKKAFHILLMWMAAPIGYLLYYRFGPFISRTYFFNFPEAFCLIYIIFLEICIQSGLIISNRKHDAVFAQSSVMAEITDMEHNTINRTKSAIRLSDEEKKQAKSQSGIVEATYELHAKTLKGGFVFWLNDIGELLRVNHRLKEQEESLVEENSILKAEIVAIELQTSLEEQNRIYDTVNEALAEKRRQLLLLADNPKQIHMAMIIAAYMKRKGNMVILSRQTSHVDIRELGLCINESFSCLRIHGCVCNCTVSGEGSVPVELLMNFYDVFEILVEQTFAVVKAFLVYAHYSGHEVTMRCQLDCREEVDISTAPWGNFSTMEITFQQQDSTLFLTGKARGGGP